MKYLIDTHCFLWAAFEPRSLSKLIRERITNPENEVAVSVVSFWEISLKYALGKLELKGVAPEDLLTSAGDMGLEVIELSPTEATSFYRLPRLAHKDPFDRLIIWQAIQRKFTLLSKDERLQDYRKHGLRIEW